MKHLLKTPIHRSDPTRGQNLHEASLSFSVVVENGKRTSICFATATNEGDSKFLAGSNDAVNYHDYYCNYNYSAPIKVDNDGLQLCLKMQQGL